MFARLKALETAVSSTPNTVIGRYLLGRAYRLKGEHSKSLEILEPIIKNHIEEFRAFIEYSTTLLESGQPLNQAIAVLNMSTTYGLSDARFIATLGGMIFLDGNFSSAKDIFLESTKRELPYEEIHNVHFRPRLSANGKPFQLRGKIIVVRPKYVIIESEGYPTFICPASKWLGVQLKEGILVDFCVEFSASGPVALKLLVI